MSPSTMQRLETRDSVLGEGMRIRRALPSRLKRTVGAWCFLDHFGPLDVRQGRGLRVGPHPHIGLQTFTWPIAGEILHRDSLGYEQVIRPGQVNLMTAGRGIAHSEESPVERSPQLHGAQLWIALPKALRDMPPAFEHYPEIPVVAHEDYQVSVLVGEALGRRSPVRVHSPLLGLELLNAAPAQTRLALDPAFEHALLVLEGEVELEGQRFAPGALMVLPAGASSLALRSAAPSRSLLLGGEPLPEEPLIWWNFVGHSKDEISRATHDWNHGAAGFGEVRGYDGARLVAPPPPWMTEPGA